MRKITLPFADKFSTSWWYNVLISTLGTLLLIGWILVVIAFAVVSVINGWPNSGLFIGWLAVVIASAFYVKSGRRQFRMASGEPIPKALPR